MSNTKKEKFDLSIVVPLYNEEESVVALYSSIVRVIDPLPLASEVLFVDDGSKDKTFQIAEKLAENDSRLRVVKFRKNYGQTPAMVAGIEYAQGEIIVTMDGDLQNDPSDIPHFVEKISEGYDLVVGWRHRRQDALITRKIPSKIANWLIGKITGVPIKDNGCSLKAYRAEIIKGIPLYSEMHRFIPAMASIAGSKIAEIKVKHHARQYGVSKYGLSRTYKVIIDLCTVKTILSFISRPVRIFSIAALLATFVGLCFLMGFVVQVGNFGNFDAIIFPALGILYVTLGIVLGLWGLLAEFIYNTGNLKIENFTKQKICKYN